MFESEVVAAEVGFVCAALGRLAALPHAALEAARTGSLLTAAADLEHAQTVVSLAQARVLAALDVVVPLTWLPGRLPAPPPVPGVDQTTAHEIAATLGSSVAMVRDRVATARVLGDLPGVVAAATAGSLRWWQVRRVAEAVAGLAPAARALVDSRVATDALAGRCRNRFGARLTRAVLAADPGRADRAHRDGVADRRVTVRPTGAGMAWFGACLPAEDALTVARCLDELAAHPDGALLDATHTPPAPDGGSGCTADQRRADALTALARAALEAIHDCAASPDGVTEQGLRDRFTHHLAPFVGTHPTPSSAAEQTTAPAPSGQDTRSGPTVSTPTAETPTARTPAAGTPTAGTPAARTGATEAAPGPSRQPTRSGPTRSGPTRKGARRAARRRAEIQLVVSAETILGIADDPAELAGYGPIGPEQARRIAHLAGTTWHRLITDPVTGEVLDRGRTAYTPPATLADHVRARYGWTCTRPGCSNVATDLDHATAWAESGTTSVDNLHPVCQGCHTAKHRGWAVRIDPDGTTTWRTPHGRSTSTRPTDHRPEDRAAHPDHPPRRTADQGGDTVPRPDGPPRAAGWAAPATPASDWWTQLHRDVTDAGPPAVIRTDPVPAPF